MHAVFRSKWGLLARSAAVLAGTLVLAACAMGYSYVQPEAAGSGNYYTSDAPYTGQGYYDYYGTGPYYPGTSGWGYYNGTAPYAGSFGWFDGNFDDFGTPIFFNLGISDVWGFPGYWGPWYSIDFPLWGCWNGCWRHHHRHDHWRGHWNDRGRNDPHDAVAATNPSSRLWLRPGRSPMASRVYRAPARPSANFASRRPLVSPSFAPPRDFERPAMPQPSGIGARPAYRTPGVPALAERPMLPDPVRSAPPHAFARSAAASFTPARTAPSHSSSDHATSVKIP